MGRELMPKSYRTPLKQGRWLGLCWLLCAAIAVAEPIKIGAEDDWYPYSGLRDGQIQGMSVDIVQAAFAASGTPIELIPYPYSRCMHMAKAGALAACFNTAPNAEIAKNFLLPTEPLFSGDIQLWARADQHRTVTSLEQLAGQRVAVTIGYEYGDSFDRNPLIERIAVRQDLNGFLMLDHQRVDYTIAYQGTADQLFRDHPELAGHFVPIFSAAQPKLYLSFSRVYPQTAELRERFDQGMRQIKQNGSYQKILQRWQGKETAAQ